MKHRILYYSDCSFFAGCENMIANFLNDKAIRKDFSVSLAYNFSIKYEHGLNERTQQAHYKKFSTGILKQLSYHKPISTSPIYLIIHKTIFGLYLLLYKYFSLFVNTFILFRFFRRQEINILHINNGGYPGAYSCTSAVFAGKLAGINKIIYVVNNIAQDFKRPDRWLDYTLDFFVKRFVTVFITGSEYAGVRLRKILNLDKNKSLVINNGIERREVTLTKDEFRIKYSIPKNKLLASVVANLEKRKGHIFLFEAILQIKKQCSKSDLPFFVIEGVGSEKEILKNFILENDLAQDILMLDYMPNVFNLLNASDFVILPSIENEDFPNIIIEAMSLGKVVIGTKIAGIPEQIVDFKTGLIIKPNDSEELKEAILKLATDPGLIQQLSIESLSRFDTLYEKSIAVKKYQSLYKSIF